MLPDLLQFQRDFTAAIDRPATGGVAVHRNTSLHGTVEALRSNYPVTEQILGSEMFDQVAVDFAATYPPRSPVLALYGEEFPLWLTRQGWVGDLPYVPDVARVERLHIRALFAPDEPPSMPRQSDRRLSIFRLHPSAQFTWLSTPAMSIWLAHQRPTETEIAPDWKAEGALYVRPRPFVMHALRIGRAAHRMLSGIRLGETISAARDAAARLYPDEDCTAVFASIVNLGVFATSPSERTR